MANPAIGLPSTAGDAARPGEARPQGAIATLTDVIGALDSAGGFAWESGPGLEPALRALAGGFTLATGVDCELRLPASLRIPSMTQTALYWAVREALAKVERHARATGIVVDLTQRDGRLELAIRDDGVGLVARQGPDGRTPLHFGIRSMARCLEAVGGRLQLFRAQPRGLLIRGSVPASTPADTVPG
jgi:signal transduction histidine kinase